MLKGNLADIAGDDVSESLSSLLSNIPEGLAEYADSVAAAGGGMWLVGGAVREAVLGRSAKDWDVAVDLEPEVMMELFPDAIPTGLKYGTVTLRSGESLFEATTLRGDGNYGDGRRPDSVSYTKSLSRDLARRDFTFNAMAVDMGRGLLHDPFEGRRDLIARRLRAVGDPRQRLNEDGLRIMRAYRFLDLGDDTLCEPDVSLEKALVLQQGMLENVAVERVWSEFRRILSGRNAGAVLRRMAVDGLLNRILPGRWEKGERSIRAQFDSKLLGISPECRLALLLGLVKRSEIEAGLLALKLSKAQLKTTTLHHTWLGTPPLGMEEGYLRRYRAVLGEAMGSQLLLEGAWAKAKDAESAIAVEDLQDRLRNLSAQRAGLDSIVDGEWLMRTTKLPKGRRLGRLKEWLHRIQIERDIGDVGEVEATLCGMGWQHGDELNWPRLTWP